MVFFESRNFPISIIETEIQPSTPRRRSKRIQKRHKDQLAKFQPTVQITQTADLGFLGAETQPSLRFTGNSVQETEAKAKTRVNAPTAPVSRREQEKRSSASSFIIFSIPRGSRELRV